MKNILGLILLTSSISFASVETYTRPYECVAISDSIVRSDCVYSTSKDVPFKIIVKENNDLKSVEKSTKTIANVLLFNTIAAWAVLTVVTVLSIGD